MTKKSKKSKAAGDRAPDDAEQPLRKIGRKAFERELYQQIELSRLQEWTKHAGLRVVVVFEGRDAAGKGA